MFSVLLQKDLFKGKWSFAKSYFKQNYCHACHTRFALFFPLLSCCVSSLSKVWYHHLTSCNSFDSEDDYRTGCRDVYQCEKQTNSGLHPPRRSYSSYFSLGPGSALGDKGEKIGERIDPSGSLGRERVAEPPLPVSPPQTTARLSSLADSFPISPRFCCFPPIAEPSPRLSYLWLFTFKYMTLCCRRNCPGKENRYDEVRQKYEQDRRTVILPLGASKHNDITLITAKSPDLFYLQVAEKIRCWAPMYNMT